MTKHTPRLPVDLAEHLKEHELQYHNMHSMYVCRCPEWDERSKTTHEQHVVDTYELKYRKLCECGHARSGHGMDQEKYIENGLGVCKVMQWPDGHGMPRKCACMAYSAKKRDA